MSRHEFIFSNKRSHRLARHLCFWLCWMLFSGCVQTTGIAPNQALTWKSFFLIQLVRTVNRLLPQLFFCYFVVYFLVPRFAPKRRYIALVVSVIVSLIALILFNYLWFYLKANEINAVLTSRPLWSPFITKFFSYYSNINFTGALPACCLMLAIKYYKDWYKKQRESENLRRENKMAELQLLKAQIHPHFLFNTLNNIYSFTLTGSVLAEDLVKKLSGMIDYITTEGPKPLVPLSKEIQLLHDYIGLERVRYDDRLAMEVKINGNYKNKLIAPLLLIPFVENCFKHGASAMRGRQWIRLAMNIDENWLYFTISNSKPPNPVAAQKKKGIGLANVQKRLDLIYPQHHLLNIQSTEEAYTVNLQIRLQAEPDAVADVPVFQELKPAYYGR